VGKKNIPSKRSLFAQLNSVDVGCYDGKPFIGVASTLESTLINPFTKYKIVSFSNEDREGASTAIKISPNLDFVVVCTGSDWTKGLAELECLRKPRVIVSRLTMNQLKKMVTTTVELG
jgi:hypothetical protein